MATQTKRPRGRETRQALIQAGVEEINRHGVTEFSVRRIAQICGVSCGAPYKHFGDRREIIAAVIEYVNDQWRAEQTKILTAYEGDLQKQLVEVSTGYVKFLVEHPHLRAILTLKVYVVRALILGAAIQFENGELTYGEEALQMVHDCIQQALELA